MSSGLIKDLNREYNDVETALNRIQTHKGVQGSNYLIQELLLRHTKAQF